MHMPLNAEHRKLSNNYSSFVRKLNPFRLPGENNQHTLQVGGNNERLCKTSHNRFTRFYLC